MSIEWSQLCTPVVANASQSSRDVSIPLQFKYDRKMGPVPGPKSVLTR